MTGSIKSLHAPKQERKEIEAKKCRCETRMTTMGDEMMMKESHENLNNYSYFRNAFRHDVIFAAL